MESKYISIWLDRDSDPEIPCWIVSRDTETTTDTISVYSEEEYDAARDNAIRIGKIEGRKVFEIDDHGVRFDVYSPATP